MPRQFHVGTPPGQFATGGPPAPPGPVRHPRASAPAAGDLGSPSRRAVLRGAAGAGAASVAATAFAGLCGQALAAQATPGSRASRPTAASARDGSAAEVDSTAHIVVHVKDPAAGDIDIFRETTLIRLHDPELAARLVRASRA